MIAPQGFSLEGQIAALSAQGVQTANKVNDHSTAVQALQVDMHHLVKAVDKLVGVSEKQTALGAELQRHSESIDRAFRQMDGHKSELVQSVDKLTASFTIDRNQSAAIAAEVLGFKRSVATVRWLGAGYGVLLTIIGVMYINSVKDLQQRAVADYSAFRSDFDRRKGVVDLRLDTQSQQLQEANLRLQRILDTQGVKP